MNLSPDVIEQILWFGLYLVAIVWVAVAIVWMVASILLAGFSVTELIHGRKKDVGDE